MVEVEKVEHQRGAKQPRVMQTRSTTEGEKRVNHQAAVPIWAPRMELDGAPFLNDASIQDFQRGTVGYMADVVE